MQPRNVRGSFIIEFAAVLMLGLPIFLILLYAAVEACRLFAIRSTLDVAARSAARVLAINYGQTHACVDTYTSTVSVPQYIAPSANQWTVAWDASDPPAFVTVTCHYPPGGDIAAGLPPFPEPDIFGLGSAFTISSTFTMPLE